MKIYRKKLLIVIFVLVILGIVIICTYPYETDRDKTISYAPQAREIFELSKDKFDMLKNSQLMTKNARINFEMAIVIPIPNSSDHNLIHYKDWNTIEWLSDEEKQAIIFLMSSEDLPKNFEYIDFSHGTMGALLYPEPECLAIRYKEWWGFVPPIDPFVLEDLEDGYSIWIFKPLERA